MIRHSIVAITLSIGLTTITTMVEAQTLSIEIVEVNGVDVGPAPVSEVAVVPGNLLTVEIFLRDWSPNGERLRGYQTQIDSRGFTSGTAGNIYPEDWKITTDLNGKCTQGTSIDGIPNYANVYVDEYTCFDNTDDDPAGSDLGPWSNGGCFFLDDCLPPDGICAFPSIDWVLGSVTSGTLPLTNSIKCDHRHFGFAVLGSEGPISNQDGSKYYLGTVLLRVSPDAAGRFTLCLDSTDSSLISDENDEHIVPLYFECATIVVGPCESHENCNDGLFCNGEEACNFATGICEADGVPCSIRYCDEESDACVDCLTDSHCSDGIVCNGQEYCDAGVCEIGPFPCPGRLCDEVNETCVDCLAPEDCDDGWYCNGQEICLDGTCSAGNPPCPEELCLEDDKYCLDCLIDGDCDDGHFCNGAETCFDGMCMTGINPCPGQLCNEGQEYCVDCFSDDDCDDGAYCNGQEVCISNVCIVESDPCPGQFCDEVSSRCVDCFVAEDCDDEFFCNGLETCWGGQCVAGSPPCIDLDCDELNDVCAAYSNAENGDDEENSADSNSFSGDDNNATSDDEEILPPTQGAPEDQVSDTGICGNGINFMAALMLLGIGFMRSRLRLQRW